MLPPPKPGLTTRKVLLLDYKGILYYEVLQFGQTLNSSILSGIAPFETELRGNGQNLPMARELFSIKTIPDYTRP